MPQTIENIANNTLRDLVEALAATRGRSERALQATGNLVKRQMVENALEGHGEGATHWRAYSEKYARRKKGGRRVPVTLRDTGYLHKRWMVRTPKGTRTFMQGRNRPTFSTEAARFREAKTGRFMSSLEALRMEKDIVNDTPYLIYHTSDQPRHKIPLRRPGLGDSEARGFAREGARRLRRAMLPARLKQEVRVKWDVRI